MPDLVYKRAGHVKLVRRRDGKVFQAAGIVQSISPLNLNRASQNVTDGNNAFDRTFSNGATGGITLNLNSFNPTFWAAVASATAETGKTVNIPKYEEILVPESAPYTVTLKATPVSGTVVIVDENNEEFTDAGGAPAAEGEYQLTTDTLTFYSGDAGKKLVVTYEKQSTSATEVSITGQENVDVFELTVYGEAVLADDEGTSKADAVIFDSVMALGDLNHPTRQKEIQGYSVSFTLQPPRPGKKAVRYLVEE